VRIAEEIGGLDRRAGPEVLIEVEVLGLPQQALNLESLPSRFLSPPAEFRYQKKAAAVQRAEASNLVSVGLIHRLPIHPVSSSPDC